MPLSVLQGQKAQASDRPGHTLHSLRSVSSLPVLHICRCTVAQSCPTATPWTVARQAPLISTVSWRWLKFMSIESVKDSTAVFLPGEPHGQYEKTAFVEEAKCFKL